MALHIGSCAQPFPFVFGIICRTCDRYSEWKTDRPEDVTELRCPHCTPSPAAAPEAAPLPSPAPPAPPPD